MAHWGGVLITVGLLVAPLTAGATELNPYSSPVAPSPKPPKAQGVFSPKQGTGTGSVPRASPTRAPGTTSDLGKDYKIGPLDVLDIQVFGVADLSGTVEVAENGSVQLPLIGETPAAGKTAEEIEQDITSRLETYLQHPQVRATVK